MGVSKIFKVLIFSTLCIFAIISAAVDTSVRMSLDYQVISEQNPNKKTILKSSQSSVRIISSLHTEDYSGITSTSSGTYIEHKDLTYILTTAHSIIGHCEDTFAIADELMYQCEEIIILDHDIDMAILQIGVIDGKSPIKIINNLYPYKEVRKSILVHNEIIYTGYPQGIGPLTFDGKIVSHPTDIGYVFAHSYAWSGSSGSGVFDTSGMLIGLITAVSVANSEYGVDVMEDLVIITPLSLADVMRAF